MGASLTAILNKIPQFTNAVKLLKKLVLNFNITLLYESKGWTGILPKGFNLLITPIGIPVQPFESYSNVILYIYNKYKL